VYELAVHFHKMAYQPDERDAVLSGWLATMPADRISGWERDLVAYRAHERVKSAIVDTVRYTQLIAGGELTAEGERHLLTKLTGKLNAAGEIWGWTGQISQDEVEAAVRAWPPDPVG
jgi:hypothetical protein